MSEPASVLDYREPEWVAKKLGLDKNTVYKYLQEGWLPGVQLGRKWLISERLLAEHLEKETRSQTAGRRGQLPHTPRLHRTIDLATKYAISRGQDFVGTEHLLIGMIHEAENVGVQILKTLNIDITRPQQLFESRIPPANGKPRDAQLTDAARDALRLAQEQSTGMGHTHLGNETLLLGLILEPTGMGGQLLRELGVTFESARTTVLRLVHGRE